MKILICLTIWIMPLLLNAQISVERSVFSSLGSSNTGIFLVDATVGEASTGAFSNSAFKMTIGFHQTYDIINSNLDESSIEFNISPNPADHFIQIFSDQKIAKITLVDILGKIVYTQKLFDEKIQEINFSQLPGGLYFIQIKLMDNKIIQQQIIIH